LNNPDEPDKFLRATSAIWNIKFDFDQAALDKAQREIGDAMDYDLNMKPCATSTFRFRVA